MKKYNFLKIFIILSLITNASFVGAQQFKYIPRGKVAKPVVISPAINPKLSPVIRQSISQWTTKTTSHVGAPIASGVARVVAAAQVKNSLPVERGLPVTAPVTQADVAAGLKLTQGELDEVRNTLERLESNLAQLEEYVRTHDNRLPSQASVEGLQLRKQVRKDVTFLAKSYKLSKEDHSFFQRYKKALGIYVQFVQLKYAAKEQTIADELAARIEPNLARLEEYARTHDNQLPPMDRSTEMGNLRWRVSRDIAGLGRKMRNHPLIERYHQLTKTRVSLVQ